MNENYLLSIMRTFSSRLRCLKTLGKAGLQLDSPSNFLFVAGAQKGGTTSLHYYLAQHPLISEGVTKELSFFHKDQNFKKGVKYFRALFPIRLNGQIAMDSTPENLYSSLAPARIQAFFPNAKIVVVLREPVSRALSAYNMYKQLEGSKALCDYLKTSNEMSQRFFLPIAQGKKDASLDYFLDTEKNIMTSEVSIEEPALIRRGIYYPQIKQYIDLFGKESVLVLFSEDLKGRTEETVGRVLDFIGVETMESFDMEPKHELKYKVEPSAKEKIQHAAGKLFEQDKRNLLTYLDLDVPW